MMDEHGWWLRFADNTYPKGIVRDSGDISHSWEQINGIGGPLMKLAMPRQAG